MTDRSKSLYPAKRLAFAVLLLGAAAPSQAQPMFPELPKIVWADVRPDPVSFEGTWKLATPTTTLKPIAGPVPFTAEGRKRYDANKQYKAKRAYDEYDITTSRCSSPGVPRLMLSPGRFKIWQRQGVVTFDYEWNRALRQVELRRSKIDQPLVPNMTGQSIGHWEGNTLVAVTTDTSERTLIDDLVPHSDGMKTTERFRLLDPDTLEDHITIEDPKYFTKPWDAVLTFKRQPDVLFAEDVCLDRHDAKQPALVLR